MGRRKWSEIEGQPPVPPEGDQPAQQNWPVAEKIRISCPVCGLMATEDAFLTGPHEVKVRLQRFGGSFPSPDGTNKQKRGYMEYQGEQDWPAAQAELKKWVVILKRKLREALKEFGNG